MEIFFRKQPEKYLKKTDANTYAKLMRAIDGLQDLTGDIIKLQGSELFRLKIHHYRIIFSCNMATGAIIIEEINTRGDVYK
jgi:Cytotoxic translational repressor of toxin-antitoxin stability system